MSAEVAKPTMNAKERRKLLRQQEREKAAGVNTAAAVETLTEIKDGIKTESTQEVEAVVVKTKSIAVKQENASVSTTNTVSDTSIPAAGVNGEKLNAKQRRLLARQNARNHEALSSEPSIKTEKSEEAMSSGKQNVQEQDTKSAASKKRKRGAKTKKDDEAGDDTGDGNAPSKRKSIHLTLFVGQLPYNATEQMIRKHFHESGEIQLRMMTDKKTKKFKGTAFIEVKDSKALGAALSRHHTLMNGRRINVELTASGGGNKSEQRRQKIDLLRKKQSNVQVEKTKALIQKHIDSPEYKLTQDDVDDRMIDFLSWFDYETAKKALEEYSRCVSDRVQNRKAFFMGILKRFRQTDGVE